MLFTISVISFNGNLFISTTSSINLVQSSVVAFNLFQSKSLLSSLINLDKLIEPKLQDSYGNKGCSPQGFVDSISPICGVGLSLFILSKNIIPGSPFFQAITTIKSKTCLAGILLTIFLVEGSIRS